MARGKKKGQQSAGPDEAAEDTSNVQPSAAPSTSAQVATDPAPKAEAKGDDDDDGGLGLGLGGGKKRNRKKKPKADSTVEVAKVTQQLAQAAVSEPPPPQQQAAPPGLGRGWTALQSAPAPIPGFAPPPGYSHPAQAPPGFVKPQVYTPQPQQGPSWQQPPMQQVYAPKQEAYGPQDQGVRQQARPADDRQQARSAGDRQQAQPTGVSQQAGPAGDRQQAQPTGVSQQAGPAGDRQQAQPTGVSQQAGPAGDRQQAQPTGVSQQAGPTGDRQQTPVTEYRIPAKIIGNRVQVRPRTIFTNYLPMIIKDMKIHRYDVACAPERPKKLIPRVFQEFLKHYYPKCVVAHDQMKLAFSVKPLPDISQTARKTHIVNIVDDNGKKLSFEVSLKGTGIVDLGTILRYMESGTSLSPPTEAIQCVDVILRQGTLEKYVKAGRTFFKRPARPIDLSDGLEMWTGLFQSAIFTSRPFINIDVAHKGFAKQQPIISVLELFGFNTSAPLERQRGYMDRLMAFLKGLRLVAHLGGDTTLGKREYIFNDIVAPATEKRFPFKGADGKERMMSVAEYFIKEKKCSLRYPHLNCFWVGPRDKTIFYPLELLEVAYGQVLNRQLTDRQLSTMVREAATPPSIRQSKIHEVIRDISYSRNAFFKTFGLDIKEEFTKVEAKIIRPPILDYCGGQVEPRNGQWQSKKLLQAATLTRWGFVALTIDARAANAENVIRMFRTHAQEFGMHMDPPMITKYNLNQRDLENLMHEALKVHLQLLFVVVPGKGPKDNYAKTKQSAERRVGMLTQCLRENTAGRMNPQTARNLLLKVNSKLMGVNQALADKTLPACLRGGGVMVVGADVTHPSPDQSNVPSIAAVTASIDKHCFQYNIGLSIQTPKKEMIVEFEDIMVEHLKVYIEKQKALPKKIYVFRDGVSEGQFGQVMQSELKAIVNAYQRMNKGVGRPEILFMLVQKRHHTRFFSSNNPTDNVEPGTVVDKDIVHARELDFYLVSHQAIKGTARPTRYHAVCNDGKLPSDEVEQLAYYLCHLYSRCSRAVSYPTPTYYAHLACLRARVLTLGQAFDNSSLERQPQRLHVLDRMLVNSRMFFV